MLEVCVDNLQSALNAIHGGADEIEVCSSLAEGGLTPSIGLVSEIIISVNNLKLKKVIHKSCSQNCPCIYINKKPKINIMLRCRTGSDFIYSATEMETMLADLNFMKTLEVDRFVFGAIDIDQHIDQEKCRLIVDTAKPIPVTFHRAFDICKDPIRSLETAIDIGFNRILTSGQQASAADEKALLLIKKLLEKSNNRIEIMPGAGINYENTVLFVNIGCRIIHSSCKKLVELPKHESLSMGSNESSYLIVADEDHVRKIKMVLST